MSATAVLAAAAASERAAAVRSHLREVWSRYAAEDDTIAPSDVHSVLKDLDYGRRELSLGKGLHRTTLSVAALPSDAVYALQQLGVSDADMRSTKTRVAHVDFERWCVCRGDGRAARRVASTHVPVPRANAGT